MRYSDYQKLYDHKKNQTFDKYPLKRPDCGEKKTTMVEADPWDYAGEQTYGNRTLKKRSL